MPHSAQRVLFLTHDCPFPPIGAPKLREATLLRILSERMEVELLCFRQPGLSIELADVPKNVKVTFLHREKMSIWKRVLAPTRPFRQSGFSSVMAEALKNRSTPGKILWISRLSMAQYVPLGRTLGFRVILDAHSAQSSTMMDTALSDLRKWPTIVKAAQFAYFEGKSCAGADLVVVASEIDASRIHKLGTHCPVHVIPHVLDSSLYHHLRSHSGAGLLFWANLLEKANVEGLEWFSSQIMPRMKASLQENTPKITVAATEAIADSEKDRLEALGFTIQQNLRSIEPLLSESAIVFIPLRSRASSQLKILEAMAAGRPVVTTGLGAEGLTLKPTYDVFIADQEDAYTSAILRLLRDPELRAKIGANAIRTVDENYDWRSARPLVDHAIETAKNVLQ